MYILKTDKYSSHNQIAGMVATGSKVLDVGCSTGQLAELIRGKECYTVGIDSGWEDLKKARYDKKILCDIEKNLPKIRESFDLIIFADVLEHLRDPERILKAYRKYLSRDGRIVVSLPNVANLYVRIKLLFGKFDYQERGIMDKTHLRFFTLSSAKSLFKDHFLIEDVRATPIPLQLANRKLNVLYKPLYWLTRLFPTVFGYQFIFRLKPK